MSEFICTASFCPYRDQISYYQSLEELTKRCKFWDTESHFCSLYKPSTIRTNADKIRSMTDKELAEFLETETDCYYRFGKSWLGWLKAEVEE